MLPWLVGGVVGYVAKKVFFDDDYDDDYDDDSAERARKKARESKKDRILSDIKQYKKETNKRFKEKYGLKIDFDSYETLRDLRKERAITEAIIKAQNTNESVEVNTHFTKNNVTLTLEPTQKSIDKRESLEEEIEELEMFIDELESKSQSKLNHIKRKMEFATKDIITKVDNAIFKES